MSERLAPDAAFASSGQPPAPVPRRGFGLRFSLRTLLLVMVLIAVYLGGRASLTWQYALAPALAGDWEAKLPAGFMRTASIQNLGGGTYLLKSRAPIFNGKYKWRNGLLVMEQPADDRMQGLEWKWDGQSLTLVSEPKNTPTGSSYTGTILSRPPAAKP